VAVTEREIIEKLEKEIIQKRAEALEGAADELRHLSGRAFGVVVNYLAKDVLAALLRLAGKSSADTLSGELQIRYLAGVVAGFNGVLPADYPFIVIAVDIADEPGMTLMTMRRSLIPSTHEMTSRAVVPICFAESRAKLLNGELKFRSEWVGGENVGEF